MEEKNPRYYTRYKILLEGRVALEKGSSFPVEILDLSVEGAKLRTTSKVPLFDNEPVSIVIKWKTSIKAKAEIKWVKEEKFYTEFGIKFTEMDMANREALSSLVSEYALSSLTDEYLR